MTSPKFRPAAWNPEDRDRRLCELVELFGGEIRNAEDTPYWVVGVPLESLKRIEELLRQEFPGSGPISHRIL